MKTLVKFAAAWGAAFVGSLVAITVGAALAGKGMSAGEQAVMVLIPLQLCLFAGGTVGFALAIRGQARRAALVVLHGVVALGTVLFLAVATMLAFNR